MEAPKRKMPLLYIGVIVFLVIAIFGILFDVITDIELLDRNGAIAVMAVVAAFLILAVFIIIDVVLHKVSESKSRKAELEGQSQFNVPAEQRFLRHSDDDGSVDFSPVHNPGSFDGFEDGFDDGFDSMVSSVEPDDGMTDLERMEKFSPSMVLRRRAAELRAQQEGTPAADDPFASGDDYSAYAPEGVQPDDNAGMADDEAFAEDSDVLQGMQPETAEYGYDQPYDDQDDGEYYDDHLDEPDYSQTDYQQPELTYAQSELSYEAPAPVPVAAERVGGQSLEDFYADMSEEDILYRDCVEVWASDAKPCVMRLIKLAEELEDKQLKVSFGREIEYINAMIDRIYCFTQLEYVDELLELEEQNFAVLVKECLKRFSPFFMEKRLGLLWKGLDVNVMTDKKWFIFALTQVIFNSVEFTPAGGKIAISAKQNGDYIDLMVDDSGKGISPDELPCVFIAGYMGDESPNEEGRRTGMGLFIAQSVLRKMGGDAFIESNPGKGTRVTLRVPAIKPQAK